jgi:isopenicillin-N epimerase
VSAGLRGHWSLDPDVVFLNHGSFGACPRPVLEAAARVRAELEHEPVRYFERTLEPELALAREAVASFVGAEPEDVVFVGNSTTGVNAVLRSLELGPGDAILVTDHGYGACRNAVDYVARRTGAEVVVVKIPLPIVDPAEVVERVLLGATSRVKLALLDHVTSQTGLVFPIAELVAALRARGIETLVDGAHAPGMLSLDLAGLGAGYYVGNFHKWVCSPKGAALLWVRRDLQPALHPLVISHGYGSNRARARFLEEFDWTGTLDPSAWLAVPEAIRFVGSLVPGGWPEVRARNRALALAARALLSDAIGLPVIAPESMIGSLAALRLPDAAPGAPSAPGDEVLHRALLDAHRIEVPVFPWPSPPSRMLRVSAHLYNTLAEYEHLARALVSLLASR